MKKIMCAIVSVILVFSFSFNRTFVSSYANEPNKFAVNIKGINYYKELLEKNERLNARISELRTNNIKVDTKVKSINGNDFIYYSNSDNSVVGLIQVNDKLYTEMKVNSINEKPETVEFIKQDGERLVLGLGEDGKFSKVIYKTPKFRKAPSWCPYVVGLVGSSVVGLYSTIAGMVGGPIAAVIVAGVGSLGWTFVTEQCK